MKQDSIAAYRIKLQKSQQNRMKQHTATANKLKKYDEFADIAFGKSRTEFDKIRRLNKLKTKEGLRLSQMNKEIRKRDILFMCNRLMHFRYCRNDPLQCNIGEKDLVVSNEVMRLLDKHKIFDENNHNKTKTQYYEQLQAANNE
eukprot:50905_1